ncbi:DUF2273 domain-containing protein [Cryobacterium algoricola]|uniref:DUF2273 domain-containing protein n=1 Tax=Cryobacterium algoricola TaxID=1259183 RepID=A0ABY2IDN0_9MICO|nr:DUF2273 domain-containing protein [Cryobacterium algoricola]
MNTATKTGALVGALLALTWLVFGFWSFFFVAVAMGVGGAIGRIIEGKLSMARLIDAFRGTGSSS